MSPENLVEVGHIRATDEGLWVSAPGGVPLDVMFDGRRVWSASLERADGDTGLLAWPPALVPHLNGRAVIEVREHGADLPLARATVTLGSSSAPLELVDDKGRPLSLHKWGKLNQTFETLDAAAREHYLDQVERVLDVLANDCSLPAFISFGTLLGAVRDGRLIGHDVDVDLGYLSRHDTPVDGIRESFAVERVLRDRLGWRVHRANGGFLQIFPPQLDGSTRNIDVFTCLCTSSGRLYQVNDIATKGDRSVIVPLQTIELEGRRLPAPAQPEVLLRAAYGRGWRVPDPTFRYKASLRRHRIQSWVGGLRENRDRWSRFYRDHGDEVPTRASRFARWVEPQLDAERVIDVGCGNGRDVAYFARHGHAAVGLDVLSAPSRARLRSAARRGLPVAFQPLNLASLRDVLTTGTHLGRADQSTAVVARMLLHGLDDATRDYFWRLCRAALHGGGRAYLEFRVPADADRPKHFTWDKGTRTLDPDIAVAEALRYGATLVQRTTGTGFAPFHEEDPVVCRLVLEWPAQQNSETKG